MIQVHLREDAGDETFLCKLSAFRGEALEPVYPDQGHHEADVRRDEEDRREAREDPGEVLHGEGAQGRVLSSGSPPLMLSLRRCDARSWVWGSPAANLSNGRSTRRGRLSGLGRRNPLYTPM